MQSAHSQFTADWSVAVWCSGLGVSPKPYITAAAVLTITDPVEMSQTQFKGT